MEGPRIDQINIVVRDADATAEFLRALGLELPSVPPAWASHHRTVPSAPSQPGPDGEADRSFGIDLDSSAFAHEWGGLDPSFTGVVVDVRVDERSEVDRLHDQACSIGGRSLKSPYDAFWGARFAVVEGPSSFVVGIMSVSHAAYRSTPPDPSSFA